MEVMCLGMSRTGTTSLAEAMEILGYGTMYSSREMLLRRQDGRCAEILEAKYDRGRTATQEQLDSLWGDYRAISGEFAALMAEECIALYPRAKIVLTVRDDEQEWAESVKKTMWHAYNTPLARVVRMLDARQRDLGRVMALLWRVVYGNDVSTQAVRAYREHNARVRRLAGEGRLLVFDVRSGWSPLCAFLGKPLPAVPFPHENDRVYFNRKYSFVRRQTLQAFVTTTLLPVICTVAVAVFVTRRSGWHV